MSTPQTLPAIVRAIVDRNPDRDFFTFRDLQAPPDGVDPGKGADRHQQLTYGQLWSRAAVVAEALQNIPPGGRVLVVLPIGCTILAAHLGTMLRGAIPILHSHPSEKMDRAVYMKHLSHVLELLEPDGVITNREFATDVDHAVSKAGVKSGRLIIADSLAAQTSHEPTAWQSVRPDQIAIIQHSSGSTGLQKGVALTHEMVAGQCASYGRRIQLNPETDRICSWIPLYHDMGLFTTWFLPLLSGTKVAAIDPFRWVQAPASFLKLITDFKGTLCWQPNFAYNLLASRMRPEDLAGLDLSCMRGFNNCSEPVRAASHDMFLQRFQAYGVKRESLWVCYAMAENSFAVTSCGSTTVPVVVRNAELAALSRGRFEEALKEEAQMKKSTPVVSVGSPIEGCEVKVVDSQRSSVAEAEVGELALRSPFALHQYFRNPEATRDNIDGDGWYYTGDLGFQHQGQFFITGRKKDLLIVGGRNFYPQDIEAVCDTCPNAVPGRSVAIGVEDERTGTERIIVLIESQVLSDESQVLSDSPASPAESIEQLEMTARQRIFEELDCPVSEVHVVPHRWLVKTTSGKIARRPNLDRYREELAGKSAAEPASAPATDAAAETQAAAAGPLTLVAVTFVLALAFYLILALQPNASWGVYAGF